MMSGDYTIHYQEIVDRLAALPNIDDFGRQHRIARVSETFKVLQDIPPNPGQENVREALRALGFGFQDDQAIIITHDQRSPMVDGE